MECLAIVRHNSLRAIGFHKSRSPSSPYGPSNAHPLPTKQTLKVGVALFITKAIKYKYLYILYLVITKKVRQLVQNQRPDTRTRRMKISHNSLIDLLESITHPRATIYKGVENSPHGCVSSSSVLPPIPPIFLESSSLPLHLSSIGPFPTAAAAAIGSVSGRPVE